MNFKKLVVDERADLDTKIQALVAYLRSSRDDLLHRQLAYMVAYRDVLDKRIERFE